MSLVEAGAPAGEDEVQEPPELCCPILHTVFRDPVFVPEAGTTYEREAIATFWNTSGRLIDPLTNRALSTGEVFVNWDKRREVAAWLAKHDDCVPAGWKSREDVPPVAGDHKVPAAMPAPRWRLGFSPNTRVIVVSLAVITALAGGMGAHDFLGMLLQQKDHPAAFAPAACRGPSPLGSEVVEELSPPTGSRLRVTRLSEGQSSHLRVVSPKASLKNIPVSMACISLFTLAFTASWTSGALAVEAPLPFVCFSCPFWFVSARLLRASLLPLIEESQIDLYDTHLCIHSSVAGLGTQSQRFNYSELEAVDTQVVSVVNDNPQLVLTVTVGLRTIEWGSGLTNVEVQWCHHMIRQHLQRLLPADSDAPDRKPRSRAYFWRGRQREDLAEDGDQPPSLFNARMLRHLASDRIA